MKKCPECSRTFSDDTLSFCLEDGALLSASYDASDTQSPTVAMNAPEVPTVEANQIPPTVAMPEIPPTVAAHQIPPTVAAEEIPTVVTEKPRETQTEDKKVRWYIYLAGFFIALIYNIAATMVILKFVGSAFRDFIHFFDSSDAEASGIVFGLVLTRTVMDLVIFGSLGAILAFRWHRAKWKWGVIMALTEIPVAILYIYGYAPRFEPPLVFLLPALIFLFLVTLAIGCAASYLGSKLRQKKSNA